MYIFWATKMQNADAGGNFKGTHCIKVKLKPCTCQLYVLRNTVFNLNLKGCTGPGPHFLNSNHIRGAGPHFLNSNYISGVLDHTSSTATIFQGFWSTLPKQQTYQGCWYTLLKKQLYIRGAGPHFLKSNYLSGVLDHTSSTATIYQGFWSKLLK